MVVSNTSGYDVPVIAVVGMCGTGKSTIIKKISHVFRSDNPTVIYFGGCTMEALKAAKLPVNETNERKIREQLREQHGSAAFAILKTAEIERALRHNHLVIIDGLYSWSEYKYLREKFGDRLLVIAVAADKAIRKQRLAKRAERPLTSEEVDARDVAEIENSEKGGPIAFADITLTNNGDRYMLERDLRVVYSAISQLAWELRARSL